MLKYFVVLFLLCNSVLGNATKTTAIVTGNWSTAGTWSNGVPGCRDTIIINVGVVVTVTSTVDLTACSSVFLWVKGTLAFQTGRKMDLPCGSIVYIDGAPPAGSLLKGAGGGSSNYIDICGDTYWQASDGNVTGPAIYCDGCTLPIELLNFDAKVIRSEVKVFWSTASEINNSHFIVQKSKNGILWEELATIPGAGNSSSSLNYEIMDFNPFAGLNYYRLKQVDFDGVSEVFTPVSVMFIQETGTLYPNPVNVSSNFTIRSNSEIVDFEVYNSLGQICSSGEVSLISHQNGENIFVCNLVPGNYHIAANGQFYRLVVVH